MASSPRIAAHHRSVGIRQELPRPGLRATRVPLRLPRAIPAHAGLADALRPSPGRKAPMIVCSSASAKIALLIIDDFGLAGLTEQPRKTRPARNHRGAIRHPAQPDHDRRNYRWPTGTSISAADGSPTPSSIASSTTRIASSSPPKTRCEKTAPICLMPDRLISSHTAYVASLRWCPPSPDRLVRLGRNAQKSWGVDFNLSSGPCKRRLAQLRRCDPCRRSNPRQ